MIGAQGQLGVINVTKYSGASRTAINALGPARVKALHMDNLSYFDQLHMWTEPANYADWVTGLERREGVEHPERYHHDAAKT